MGREKGRGGEEREEGRGGNGQMSDHRVCSYKNNAHIQGKG